MEDEQDRSSAGPSRISIARTSAASTLPIRGRSSPRRLSVPFTIDIPPLGSKKGSRVANDGKCDTRQPPPSARSWHGLPHSGMKESRSNWETLQEIAGEDNGEDSDDEDSRPPLRLARSYGALKTLFRSRSAETDRMRHPDNGGPRIATAISASPPSSPTLRGVTDGLSSIEDVLENGLSNGSGDREREPLVPKQAGGNSSAERQQASWLRVHWPPSPATIAVTKCALAYLIASFFTYVPGLARILSTRQETDSHGRLVPRPAYSAHMVATIVVYFHPAKSAGNMLLADRYAVILIAFSSVVCVLSMLTLHLFDHFSPSLGHRWDWISEAGDWIVNLLYIGGTMGVLGWAKIWVANASFNSVTISNLVCFAIFPTSATTRLQNSISRSLNSFSTLLDLLTSTFLLEKHVLRSKQTSIRQAVQDHSKAFKTLKADLAEAKWERILDPRIRGRKLKLYDAAIASLGRLAQHLGGLRSSTRLQESLIKARMEGRIKLDAGHEEMLSSITLSPSDIMDETGATEEDKELSENARLFIQFRTLAGDQMNDLNAKCDDALQAVQALTMPRDPSVDLQAVRSRLSDSLQSFSKHSGRAIKRLYAGPKKEREIILDEDGSSDDNSDGEEVARMDSKADGPNETVFMIYFFLFTFEEFAKEILFLLDTAIEIVTTRTPTFWDHVLSVVPRKRNTALGRRTYLYQKLQDLVPIDPSDLQPQVFPKHGRDVQSTSLIAPRRLSTYARIRQKWWAFGEWLRQPEIRYAIKIWIGGAMLAAPAFTEWGRWWFIEYRGEWALIAFFSVNNPTLGQTNAMTLYRCGGTFIGALVGVAIYNAFPEHPILLPLAGFLFSIPCFYIVTQIPEHMQTGRFTILAFNLTCLYAYNSRERDYSVWKVAIFRSATVVIGAIWAAIISRYWWPYTARKELRLGVSEFCLDVSYLYSQLVQKYGATYSSAAGEGEHRESPSEHVHSDPRMQHFMAMELHLRNQLNHLRDLLVQTKNEPRIKGPFPTAFYNEVLLSCERIVDRLHSMWCVTSREEWDHYIRRDFIAPVNRERREMVGNVMLFLYTISAGFRLRTPMPPYLPPAETSRQRLIGAIRNLDVVKRRSVRGGGRQLLYFAYAMAMQEVIAELDLLGRMMQNNFGVISQATLDDFEDMFVGHGA